ncbi:MAG: RNA polymerase sigma factor, partial [Myxococcota bacterium]
MRRWLPWHRRPPPTATPAPGDPPALEAVYEERFDYVCHALWRLGVPKRDIEDVAQEVFIAVHRSLHTYDPGRPFLPWLYGVTFRVAKDHQRLARHHREVPMDNDGHDRADEMPDPERLTGV